MILYSKLLVGKLIRGIKKKVQSSKRSSTLAVILVGDNPASISFIRQKKRMAEKVGCSFEVFSFSSGVKENEITSQIKLLNEDIHITGIIVQLPLPKKFNSARITKAIHKKKDVDNLSGRSAFHSPTVQAIWHIFERAKISNKATVLIIGYGKLVGKPLHAFLKKKRYKKIKIIDKPTRILSTLTQDADVIMSGVGKPHLIKKVKKGAVVIDAGASLYKGKIVGDVSLKHVAKTAKYITPVPGGIGPLTVAYLFKNLVNKK